MRISTDPRFPVDPASLVRNLTLEWRALAQQVNGLSEGAATAAHNALTAAPTTGSYAVGDFIRNSAPAELGTAGSKYVIAGWMCLASGTPGTLVECRYLTGN